MADVTRRYERFAGALGLLAVLILAVPASLIAVARARFGAASPLAGVPPVGEWSLSHLRDAGTEPLSDDAVVDLFVRAGLIVVWVAIGVMIVTTVAETVHMVRHGGIALPAVRGLGWAQPIARLIAVGLIAVAPLHTPRVSLASTGGDGAHSEFPLQGNRPDPVMLERSGSPAEPPDADRADHDRTHVVRRGESIFSIAADLAGSDADRTVAIADAILDVNLGRTMPNGGRFTNPAYIEVGWRLTIPSDVAGPTTGVAAGADVHVVQPGDTLSAIAEIRLGDADAWPVLWEANAGEDMGGGRTLDDPDLILPGWSIEIPGPATADGRPAESDGAPAPTAEGEASPTVDTPHPDGPGSQPESERAEPTGTDPTRPEPDPIQPDTIQPDSTQPDTIQPDTIQPDSTQPGASSPTRPGPGTGQPSGTSDTRSESEPTGAVPSTRVVRSESEPTGAVPSTRVVRSESEPTEPDPRGEDRTDRSRPSSGTEVPAAGGGRDLAASGDVTTTTVAGEGADPSADDADTPGLPPPAPSPIGIEHAAMLAAGVLALVAIRRRQRLRSARPRTRVPEPRAAASAMERRLRLVDPGERSQRIDVSLRAAAAELVGSGVQIGLVVVDADGTVTLHLTGIATLPAPWSGGGSCWALPAAIPVDVVSDAARLVGTPCLALAQLGVTAEGSDVLVDLEACPALLIEGECGLADQIVTGLTTALAASPYAEVAHLITVSVDEAALLGHRNAHVVGSADAALELAASLVGNRSAALGSSFELRSVRTGGEAWEPAVVLLRAADDGADELHLPPAAEPGAGIAVVAAVDGAGAEITGCRLTPTERGWTFQGFGTSVVLNPVGLSPAELGDLASLLDEASAPLEGPDEIAPSSIVADAVTVTAGPERFTRMPHAIVVGLLGDVRVTDADGNAGAFERSKTVELIAWLATHRERSTRTAARTALWELDVRDATFANVVSEARRGLARLVTPPDGEEWLARTLNEQLPLHELVVTDGQLVEQRLHAARLQPPAQAMNTLRPAVETIRGVPFAGTSYLWPDAEGITSSLVLVAVGAAAELAGHALSVGDVETVFWATGRGLAVLPGHEELIALRMKAHARAGDYAGVRQEWESYERVVVADAWSDGEPAPKLVALRRDLLSAQSA